MSSELDVKFSFGWIPMALLVAMIWASCSWACDVDLAVGEHRIGCAPQQEAP